MSTRAVDEPASIRRASGSPKAPPPWLSFSARWPWVVIPCQSIGVVNGSAAPAVCPSAYQRFMIPIDSYQEARLESYVADTLSVSPGLTATFQSGLVAVIATSHDTAPAGSKYLASDRNSCLVWPPRDEVRSVYRPPGCRWPAVPTIVISWSATNCRAGPILAFSAPVASLGKVYLPFLPSPLGTLKTG